MSDKPTTDRNQATPEQARQMRMNASPVPPPAGGIAAPIELQAPVYFPDILPINVLKVDAKVAAAAAEAASHAKPEMPKVSVANVDDPTSPPHVPTEDPPAPSLYVGVLGRAAHPPEPQRGSKGS